MSSPSTVFCFVILMIALAIIGLGAYWRYEFRAAERAEPLRMQVDLSQAGEYGGLLSQKYDFGHDEGLELLVSPGFISPDSAYEDAKAAMADLRGRILIKDASGREVLEGPLEPLSPSSGGAFLRYKSGAVPLGVFHPFPVGSYTLSIRVDEPAKGLAGRSQQVVVKHWLCGCEGLMASNFAFMVGGGLIVIVGGTALLIQRDARNEKKGDTAA